uniref:B30.2/SPRY domain-containing protein n=1 Tax=Oncorhynchus tshawytscha TaxID=74940 RepID=A0A8C8IH35_ONCTS
SSTPSGLSEYCRNSKTIQKVYFIMDTFLIILIIKTGYALKHPLPGRFDTTLNVISLQGFSSGRHYWEIDVAGKTYWELGLTYPTISRKGRAEDCWLGRGSDSWAMEFFDGEYTAWHGGVPHQLPVTKHLSRIGVLCSFPAGQVSFLGADSMTPLFSFCVGAFKDCLHLALCPGHDHNGTNAKPILICNAPPTPSSIQNAQEC